jgi:hypothetical protein
MEFSRNMPLAVVLVQLISGVAAFGILANVEQGSLKISALLVRVRHDRVYTLTPAIMDTGPDLAHLANSKT